MSLPPKVITLDVADTARAKKFVTSYKSSITRKERLSESSLLLHCLGWACFAILPWIFTAFIFWFVDERLEENAQIEELRSSQTENKIAEIEAKISAAQEQIETGLSPALLLAEEEKLAELETSLSDAEKAEIARIHTAQRGEYIFGRVRYLYQHHPNDDVDLSSADRPTALAKSLSCRSQTF